MKVLQLTALPVCLQVIHQLFYFLDEADYASLVKLFTSAGCWERQEGPVAISRPFRLSIVKARLECGEGAWQVSDLRLTPEFEFVAEAGGQ